jgi:hypothetical protein
MHARRVLVAMVTLPVLALTGCNGVPTVTPEATDSPGPVVPTIGPGTVMTDALTEAHCVQGTSGAWIADGVVKNTTKQTRTFDVNIYIGPANGEAGVAQVVTVRKLAPGKSAPWKAAAVQPTGPDGPCYIRVRIAK